MICQPGGGGLGVGDPSSHHLASLRWSACYHGAMKARTSRTPSAHPSLLAWLATNTSGVPRAQARRVAAFGLILGMLLGLLGSVLAGASFETRIFGIAGGVLGGATLGALGAVLAARLLWRMLSQPYAQYSE